MEIIRTAELILAIVLVVCLAREMRKEKIKVIRELKAIEMLLVAVVCCLLVR